MRLNQKTKVLLALLAQLGPDPRLPEELKRSEVHVKIGRMLQAKNIEDELTKREKFIYRALQEVWKSHNLDSDKLRSLPLTKYLISEIQDISEFKEKEKQIAICKKSRWQILKKYKLPLSDKDEIALRSLLTVNDQEYQDILFDK